jgi:S-formylglutathione hydrolase
MQFNIFLPPASKLEPVPAVYMLSGLTCTEDNFIQKVSRTSNWCPQLNILIIVGQSGALKHAAELGLAVVVCDTSPRNTGVCKPEYMAFGWGFNKLFVAG